MTIDEALEWADKWPHKLPDNHTLSALTTLAAEVRRLREYEVFCVEANAERDELRAKFDEMSCAYGDLVAERNELREDKFAAQDVRLKLRDEIDELRAKLKVAEEERDITANNLAISESARMSWVESCNELRAKLKEAEELLYAVNATDYSGLCCDDVNGMNWFDALAKYEAGG